MVGPQAAGAARRVTFRRFEYFLAIDWSGAVGERTKGIALALCHAEGGPPVLVDRGAGWSRADVLDLLLHDLPSNTLAGFDFGMALPFLDCGSYFPRWEQSPADARQLWSLVNTICKGDPHLAASSLVDHPQTSRHFRHPGGREGDLFRADGAVHGRGRFRITELVQAQMGCKPYSNFNLVGAAQVGKSSLTGMRLLDRLAHEYAVWPVDPLPAAGPVICEIYTALAAIEAGRAAGQTKLRSFEDLNGALAVLGCPSVRGNGPIDDHSSDALLTAAWLRLASLESARWTPAGLTEKIALTEGWTFGAF